MVAVLSELPLSAEVVGVVREPPLPRAPPALKLNPAKTALEQVVGKRLSAHRVARPPTLGETAPSTERQTIGA